MNDVDLKLVVKIMICTAIAFFAIRYYFDKYCEKHFGYTFMGSTGVLLVLGFFFACLFLQFMLPERIPKDVANVLVLCFAVAAFVSLLAYNIKKTSVPIGVMGTTLQFTVLLTAVVVVSGVLIALWLASMAASTSSDDDTY